MSLDRSKLQKLRDLGNGSRQVMAVVTKTMSSSRWVHCELMRKPYVSPKV